MVIGHESYLVERFLPRCLRRYSVDDIPCSCTPSLGGEFDVRMDDAPQGEVLYEMGNGEPLVIKDRGKTLTRAVYAFVHPSNGMALVTAWSDEQACSRAENILTDGEWYVNVGTLKELQKTALESSSLVLEL